MKQNIWFVYWIASTYSVTNVNSICKYAKCGYSIFNCLWITIAYKGKLITKIVGKNAKWLSGNNQERYSFYGNCLLKITYCSLHWIEFVFICMPATWIEIKLVEYLSHFLFHIIFYWFWLMFFNSVLFDSTLFDVWNQFVVIFMYFVVAKCIFQCEHTVFNKQKRIIDTHPKKILFKIVKCTFKCAFNIMNI